MKRLFLSFLIVAAWADSGPPAQAGPLFTYSALIDGMASLSIPGSAAPLTDHFDITAEPGPNGPFDAGGLGADIRITTTDGVTMTSFQGTLNTISNQPHTFSVTIHDQDNGLSGTFMVPFTLSAMYAEGVATSNIPSHSFVPMTFTIGADTFTISNPASAFSSVRAPLPPRAARAPFPGPSWCT